MQGELQSLKRKLKLYESNACPTCESPLTTDFHQDRKVEIQSKHDNLPTQIEESEISVNGIKDKLAELRQKDRAVRDTHEHI